LNENLMKQLLLIVLVLTLCAFSLLAQIEYSGIADILYVNEFGDEGNGGFGYGQFKFDLSGTVTSSVTFECSN